MKNIVLLIIAILTIGLVGCSPAADLYKESNDIVTSDETLNELEESQKEALNARIKMYEGTIRGMEAKTLIRSLNTYNANDTFPTKLIINDHSNSNITLVDGEYSDKGIKSSSNYEISLEYGENGYITAINVNMGN